MTHDARILDFNRCLIGGRMDHRSTLIFAASLLCGSAHAFYAQATPPAGFVAGAVNTFNGAKAGVTASVELGRIAANASLNVGGKAVGIATKIPLAANAARVAALAIYSHPAVRVGLGVATLLGLSGFIYDPLDRLWKTVDPSAVQSDGKIKYYIAGPAMSKTVLFDSYQQACNAPLSRFSSANPGWTFTLVKCDSGSFTAQLKGVQGGTQYFYDYTGGKVEPCPTGWYKTPAGCVQTPPMVAVPQEEFVEDLTRHPLPPNILPELPFDLPVDVPYIDPVFIPTGNPVKNPNYDPSKPQTGENQPYVQPGVKVDPANDAKNPFQVNLQPVNRPVDNPQGSKDPVPQADPGGSGNNDKPRDPEKDERDLCEKHPDILACQKLDEPEDPGKLKVQEVDFNFQPETGFAGSASCPSPINVNVNGTAYSISWQPFCNSLNMVKPFLLAMAWLSAAFIMLGARQE